MIAQVDSLPTCRFKRLRDAEFSVSKLFEGLDSEDAHTVLVQFEKMTKELFCKELTFS